MRLFLAVNLNENLKNTINKKIKDLNNNSKTSMKLVKKDNFHITLKFLGNVDEDKINLIKEKMDFLSKYHNSFILTIDKINAFPEIDYPKVIYLAIKDQQNSLIKLHRDLDYKLNEIGFKRNERVYLPHVTLARTSKDTDIKRLSIIIKKYKDRISINNKIQVKKIYLMKSILKEDGPIYKEIYSANMS
ncbi:MAG: RNA 2',3'-cyclic phosphodiesterase [bacterium]